VKTGKSKKKKKKKKKKRERKFKNNFFLAGSQSQASNFQSQICFYLFRGLGVGLSKCLLPLQFFSFFDFSQNMIG